MKSIGIKLADGTFYPVMKDGSVEKKALDVTTVQDNQTKVQIDLYRSETDSMDDAEYVDTLEITNLNPHTQGVPSLHLNLSVDENNHLQAEVRDPETGKASSTNVTLVSRTLEERNAPVNFNIDTTTADALADIDAVDSVLKNNVNDDDALDSGKDPGMMLMDSEGNAILDTSTFTLTEEQPENEIFATQEELEESAKEPETQKASDSLLMDSEGNAILDTSTFTLTEEKPENEIFATDEDLVPPALSGENPEEAILDNQTYTDAAEENNTENFIEVPSSMEDSGTVLEEPSVAENDSLAIQDEQPLSDDDFNFELPSLDTILNSSGDEENGAKILNGTSEDELGTKESVVEDGSDIMQNDGSVLETDTLHVENESPASQDDTFSDLTFDLPNFAAPAANPELKSENNTNANVVKATLPELDLSDFESSDSSAEDSSVSSFDDEFNLPRFDSYKEEEPVKTEIAAPEAEETVPGQSEDTFVQEEETESAPVSYTELDSSAVLAAGSTDSFDLPSFDSLEPTGIEDVDLISDIQNTDFTAQDENKEESGDLYDTVMSLPDFEESSGGLDESLGIASDGNEGTDFTVPDFDSDSPVMQRNNTENSYNDSGDNDLDDFDFDSGNDSYSPQSNMFEGLYDKETINGESSNYDYYEENERNSSAAPVIVCIICAIICVLGALAVLFIIPSKFNFFNKNTQIAQTDKTVTSENNTEVKDEKLQSEEVVVEDIHNAGEQLPPPSEVHKPVEKESVAAKENEIVIATTPNQIVPEKPQRPSTAAPDIRYKIVWGDTLWDISNAYYKTPWRYKHIADYNHIKNPDYIQAGNVILIPSE